MSTRLFLKISLNLAKSCGQDLKRFLRVGQLKTQCHEIEVEIRPSRINAGLN
jgi:hypothetical protein